MSTSGGTNGPTACAGPSIRARSRSAAARPAGRARAGRRRSARSGRQAPPRADRIERGARDGGLLSHGPSRADGPRNIARPSGRAGRLQVDRAHEGEHEEDHYEQPEQARPARVVGAESVAIAVAESAIQQAGDNQRDEQQGHLAKTIASRPCVDWATATTSP